LQKIQDLGLYVSKAWNSWKHDEQPIKPSGQRDLAWSLNLIDRRGDTMEQQWSVCR
jgi:hypothetical protein